MTVEILDRKISTFLDKLRHYQGLCNLKPQTQEQKNIQLELSEQLMSLQPYLQAFSLDHEEIKLENPPMTNISDGVPLHQHSHPDLTLNLASHDLEKIQKYLTTRPRDQRVTLQESGEQLSHDPLQESLAQFSKLGHRSTEHMMFRRPTLHTTLNRLTYIVNTYITQEDQKQEFLHVLQALASHPEIAPLLPDPLSKFQPDSFS